MGTVGLFGSCSGNEIGQALPACLSPGRGEMSRLVVGLRSPVGIPMPAWEDYRWDKYCFSVLPFAALQRGSDAADAPVQDLPSKGAIHKPGNS